MLLTNENEHYFNRTALLHILFLIVLYVIIDGFVINYDYDPNAYSKGFYSKLILSILYLIGSKDNSLINQENKPIDAAFHFSVFFLCLWLGTMSLALIDGTLSRFVGVFLIFGGLSGFNLIDEILKVLRQKMQSSIITLYIIETILKVLLFAIFCLAAYFLVTGEWRWDIKPFYEW